MSFPLDDRRLRVKGGVDVAEDACAICGSQAVRRLFAARDRLHGLPGKFLIVRCAACKLLRTSPRPSGKALAAYYPEDYGPHRDTGEDDPKAVAVAQDWSGRHRWFRERVGSRRIWWMPDLPPGARVLEVGSGAGEFVRHALARGWEVHALEPAGKPAERLSRVPCVIVHRESAEAMTFPPGSLDAVFAWMVVEHLNDPGVVFRKIAAALRPGGYVVFSVPNAGSWEFVVFRARWYGLDVPRHLWHFSPRTLRHLLALCGFSVQRIFHQKVLKNISGSLGFLSADLPRLAPVTRSLARVISYPLVSFAVGAALAVVRQGGRLTVVARTAGPRSAPGPELR